MFWMRSTYQHHGQAVTKAAKDGNYRSLKHAAASMRMIAQRSIRVRKKASAAGQPPHTRGVKQLKKSILYHVDRDGLRALIGPAAHLISKVAAAHEHGRTEPANPKKRGTANWQIKLGGHGPLRRKGTGKHDYLVIKIKTPGQLAAVEKFAAALPLEERGHTGPRKYPRRSFMGPTLKKTQHRLAPMWAGAIKS